MGLFDIGADTKTETVREETTREKEIRKMSGFDSMADVKKAAATATAAPPPSDVASGRRVQRLTAEQIEAQKKAERKAKALETVGKHLCSKLASIPYELWSRFAADEHLALTPEEHKELADEYFLLAQNLDSLDFDHPIFLLAGIGVSNFVLISERLKYLGEKNELEMQQELDAERGKQPN